MSDRTVTDSGSEGDVGLDELAYCGRAAGCPVGVSGHSRQARALGQPQTLL